MVFRLQTFGKLLLFTRWSHKTVDLHAALRKAPLDKLPGQIINALEIYYDPEGSEALAARPHVSLTVFQ